MLHFNVCSCCGLNESAMYLYLFLVVPWVGLSVMVTFPAHTHLFFVVVLSIVICAINIEDLA